MEFEIWSVATGVPNNRTTLNNKRTKTKTIILKVVCGRATDQTYFTTGGGRRVGVALLTNRLVTSPGHPQLKTGHKILFYFITSIISVAMAPSAEDRQARAKAIQEAKKKAAETAAAEDP